MSRHLIATAFLLLGLVASGDGQKRQEIRDPSYRMVGTITTRQDGVREARDRDYRLLGTYNPKTNEARDRNYRLVSRGDSLAALVLCPAAPKKRQ
jgi:hypothetical protein